MEKLSRVNVIITCEHAGKEIPENYRALFAGFQDVVNSHRGWDPGTLELAKSISAKLDAPLFVYPYTRLLVEPNRSEGHPKLFSEFSKILPKKVKEDLLKEFYHPYRNKIITEISKLIKQKSPVLHLSIHSFTPVFDGKTRNIDIGILYDPGQKTEKFVAGILKKSLKRKSPGLKIRMNQPYKGKSDGFTTALRKRFDKKNYLGIEIEVNQKLLPDKTIELSGLLTASMNESMILITAN